MSLGERHLVRQRKAKLSGFPTRASVFKNAVDILIYPVALASPLALLPQVHQLYNSHNASGLALSTWILFGLLNLAWIVYGHVHRERPILLTNIAMALLNFAVAFGILLYR